MFNTLHNTIRENKLEQIKQFLYDLTHLQTADGKPASTAAKVKFFIKGFCQIAFLILGLGLALFAAITTLGAWWKALNQILAGMMASPLAAKVISGIIVMGLTTAARIPFALEKSCRFFLPLGNFVGSAIIWCGTTTAWAIQNPSEIWPALQRSLVSGWDKLCNCFSSTDQIVETIETALDFIGITLIIGGSLILNAIGNGAIAEKGGSVLENLLGFESQTAGKIALTSASIFSFGVGVDSIKENKGLKKTHAYKTIFAKPQSKNQPNYSGGLLSSSSLSFV